LMSNPGGGRPATARHNAVGAVKPPGEAGDDKERQPRRVVAATRRVSGSSPLGGALPAGHSPVGQLLQDRQYKKLTATHPPLPLSLVPPRPPTPPPSPG